MSSPTPTASGLARRLADFRTVAEALDYAARGATGLNFYSGRGELLEVLTYRALRDQSLDLARRMLAAGLVPGERVAIIAESDGDFLRAFMACQYAGLVPAPMPLPAAFGGKDAYVDHIRRMIQGAQAAAALAPAALADWLAAAADGLDLKAVGTLALFQDVSADGVELPTVGPDDLCYLQFSSGSTRFPLGVAVTQGALMANCVGITRDGLKVRDGDRATSWLPLYHDMGMVGFMLAPLVSQLSIDLLPTREFARRPLLWLQLITRNGGTLSYSPSFGYELASRRAQTASTEDIDLSGWRVAGIGGDMVRPRVLERFADAFGPRGFRKEALVASYGMAEASLALSFAPLDTGLVTDLVDLDRLENEQVAVPPGPDTERSRDFVLNGPALPGHEIQVRDEVGRPVAERQVGRVFARGPSLMREYFGRPEETAAALSAQGWLDTGDLGYLCDGQIVITGRAKDLILVNGRNIWPQDLEWTTEHQVESLRSGDVAAFSVDEDSGEVVMVLVQCRTSDPGARDALAQEVAGVLRSAHGVEVRVVLVPTHSLPQTSSGKLSRSRAKQMYLRGEYGRGTAAA
ncbi:fatty acyl-AMP ligase [Aerophototrophica crusticola]|uniref:Fatty acyl-AMP ligase n=1 Tax=Aerophototrophica crusticola TaxID=1709002 RepID=A0A858R513_9PROT|nr:fatty acyl-AMP ligase [Rhodospirillaceae bacterium B3]